MLSPRQAQEVLLAGREPGHDWPVPAHRGAGWARAGAALHGLLTSPLGVSLLVFVSCWATLTLLAAVLLGDARDGLFLASLLALFQTERSRPARGAVELGPAEPPRPRGGRDRERQDLDSLLAPDAQRAHAVGLPGPEGRAPATRPLPATADVGLRHARPPDALGGVEPARRSEGTRGRGGAGRAALPGPRRHERLGDPRGAARLRGPLKHLRLPEPPGRGLAARAPADRRDRGEPARRLRVERAGPEDAQLLPLDAARSAEALEHRAHRRGDDGALHCAARRLHPRRRLRAGERGQAPAPAGHSFLGDAALPAAAARGTLVAPAATHGRTRRRRHPCRSAGDSPWHLAVTEFSLSRPGTSTNASAAGLGGSAGPTRQQCQ